MRSILAYKKDGVTESEQTECPKTNEDAINLLAYISEPQTLDTCKVTIISQFSPSLLKLQFNYKLACKLKCFIEECIFNF